jgi:hypothetical protein
MVTAMHIERFSQIMHRKRDFLQLENPKMINGANDLHRSKPILQI